MTNSRPFPQDLLTTQGETYIVDRVINLTSNLTLAPGITLIFEGGRFESENEVSIIAPPISQVAELYPEKGVRILAPLSVIFGEKVSATGYWIAEYTSPLWFAPSIIQAHGQTSTEKRSFYDYANPINKAIAMQDDGRVYLPKGDYHISKPILLPVGITLEGDSGHLYHHNSTAIFPIGTEPVESKNGGTTATNIFPSEYMFYVNCRENEKNWIIQHPRTWTALKNITIINYTRVNPTCKCVYACGGAGFDTVYWFDFIQALAYSDDYADGKSVVNCITGFTPRYFSQEFINSLIDKDVYLFSLNGLGDGMLFLHNHIASPLFKALSFSECGGGSVQGNIIHGDINFNYCKAISFFDNHMESGPQISVNESDVTLASTMMEKGSRPLIVITGHESSMSVVALGNMQFLVYNRDREANETHENKQKRLESISETDIQINSLVSLTLDNVFRYDLVVSFGASIPFGINICKDDETSFKEFNDLSYIYSRRSSILPNFKVEGEMTVSAPNSPSFYHLQLVRWVNWFRPAGTYKYYYQVIWDSQRQIRKSDGSKTIFPLPYADTTLTFPDQAQGALLVIDSTKVGASLMIRLYRSKLNSKTLSPIDTGWEAVDVPLCGAYMLYDNGISVAGYKWKSCLPPIDTTDNKPEFETLKINSNSITAWSKSKPANFAGWKVGDLIYNSGDDETWNILIIK